MDTSLDQILLLGNPLLYEPALPVEKDEIQAYEREISLLGELVLLFRQNHGWGRAIAAPQIGLLKRIIVMNIDQPIVMINPQLYDLSEEMMELWDDCMSFPHLMVRVQRHVSCKLRFRDMDWQQQIWELEGDLSELLQHEYDHLEGILATQRAINDQAFRWNC